MAEAWARHEGSPWLQVPSVCAGSLSLFCPNQPKGVRHRDGGGQLLSLPCRPQEKWP